MQPLDALIKRCIADYGPMSLADYMGLALGHPEHGYYRRKDPLGAEGDFITAPEISQIFGELIGAWMAEQWRISGLPIGTLVELGPGRGTLMADALRATHHVAGFHQAMQLYLVETSPLLRQKQWHALAGRHPNIRWHDDVRDLPEGPLFVIANEFFDALPVRQYLHTVQGWQERMVGLDKEGELQFTGADAVAPRALQALPVSALWYEYCEAGREIVQHLSESIVRHGGCALIIDYGYDGGTRGDTLQALRGQHYHNPLIEPGSADLTTHVDFQAIRETAQRTGAAVHGPITQSAFLTRLGASMRAASLCKNATEVQKSTMLSALERLISPDQMGELFKVMAITHSDYPTPEGF